MISEDKKYDSNYLDIIVNNKILFFQSYKFDKNHEISFSKQLHEIIDSLLQSYHFISIKINKNANYLILGDIFPINEEDEKRNNSINKFELLIKKIFQNKLNFYPDNNFKLYPKKIELYSKDIIFNKNNNQFEKFYSVKQIKLISLDNPIFDGLINTDGIEINLATNNYNNIIENFVVFKLYSRDINKLIQLEKKMFQYLIENPFIKGVIENIPSKKIKLEPGKIYNGWYKNNINYVMFNSIVIGLLKAINLRLTEKKLKINIYPWLGNEVNELKKYYSKVNNDLTNENRYANNDLAIDLICNKIIFDYNADIIERQDNILEVKIYNLKIKFIYFYVLPNLIPKHIDNIEQYSINNILTFIVYYEDSIPLAWKNSNYNLVSLYKILNEINLTSYTKNLIPSGERS